MATSAFDPSPERTALAALFDAHFSSVHRFCLARAGDAGVADDVASDTFLAAARVFADGRGDEIDAAWLFVTARRRLYDHWRSLRRHDRRVRRLAMLPEAGVTPDSTSRLVNAEAVLTALESLPGRQRAALSLRYLDQFSVAEVAEALAIEYRAAESLLARARRGFATAWKEQA